MTGGPKGRTIKAVRERAEGLMEDTSSRAAGQTLDEFRRRLEIGTRWRAPSHIMTLSAKAYSDDLNIFKQESCIFPAYVCQAILKRQAQVLALERNWHQLFVCLWPWGGDEAEQFNPLAPRLRNLPRVVAWKFAAFRRELVVELLVTAGTNYTCIKHVMGCINIYIYIYVKMYTCK